MAIKRISDLPKFELRDEYYKNNEINFNGTDDLKYSHFEISKNLNGSEHSRFSSERINFSDLYTAITYNIISGNTLFSNKKIFENQVDFLSDVNFNLSGVFFLSSDQLKTKVQNGIEITSDDRLNLSGQSLLLKSDNSYIEVLSNNNEINLSSQSCNISSNNIILNSENQTIIALKSVPDGSSLKIINGYDINNNDNILLSVDENGQFNFSNYIIGSFSSNSADLAEMYQSDYNYIPGTLVKFGGEKEITLATNDVNGVITTKPGVILNNKQENNEDIYLGIAMIGRTPIRTIGKVNKFDKLELSDIPGVAQKHKANSNRKIIGISLENKDSEYEKNIEAVVKLQF